MQNRVFIVALAVLIAAAVSLLPARAAYAMTAEQYLADGNRLFREDLYWAALLRYEQAADKGLDSPLLHYNTGIAHYRAGQHIRARVSLLRAVDDPILRVVAQYNLGLNAYALGDVEDALLWFHLARDQNENVKLRTLADAAISRIDQERQYSVASKRRIGDDDKERGFAELELRARISYGSDSNVFRSPDRPYIDFADPSLPLVNPTVQSSAYVPVRVSARYKLNTLPFEGFYGAYRLAGRHYQDEGFENADEYIHELSFGSEYTREDEARVRQVHAAFKMARHDEIYFDPDDGLIRSIDGVDVDDRMSYLRYGPELTALQASEKMALGLKIKGQLWDYERTRALPEYDHEYFIVSLFGQYKFSSTSLLRLTANYSSRRFGDRPARDLDGQQRFGNPAVRYDYASVALRARQRITDTMWFSFDVEHAQRADQYVGYNDYKQDSFGFEFHWNPGNRFEFEVASVYRLYDFPNAFAFHNPFLSRKTQESLSASLLASYRMTEHLSIVADVQQHETVSNDIRIQYDRTQYVLGIRWEQ